MTRGGMRLRAKNARTETSLGFTDEVSSSKGEEERNAEDLDDKLSYWKRKESCFKNALRQYYDRRMLYPSNRSPKNHVSRLSVFKTFNTHFFSLNSTQIDG